jgi:Flp pilus assembly protein TadB
MGILAWLLLSLHIGVSAAWLGSMGYSLFVVQPKLARLAGGSVERLEYFHRELAHGNRWPVAGLICVLWLSGAGLLWLGSFSWLAVPKAALLAGATALFWWISWRAWPRRVFALPEELPALQATFRRVALTMFTLVLLAFILGLAQRL